MATKKKLLQAAAGSAGGGDAVNVEDVFSTYLYEGNGSSQIIENGINLGQSNDGGSAYFSKGVLNIADDASFQFGSGDWTVETFFYAQASTHEDGTNQNPVFISWGDDANNRWDMGWQDPNSPRVFVKIGGTNYDAYGGASHAITNYLGQWVHFAATRNGSTLRLFINGSQVASTSVSGSMPTPNTGGVYIGARSYSTTSAYNDTNTGFISNMRIVKGTALYTSSFTAPTSALTAVSGTSLLTLQGNEPFADNSSNAHTITQVGNATDAVAKTFGPFDAADAGEGGLVWIKNRVGANSHKLFDTERGALYKLHTDETIASTQETDTLSSFNANGFSVLSDNAVNGSTAELASWTFRKAPKFFDVVTFTNTTGNDEDVSHNLGAVPAMIIGKRTDTSDNWMVWHVGTGMSNGGYTGLSLNNTASAFFTGVQSDQGINSTTFNTGYVLSHDGSGNYTKANVNGASYVFYLFASNDGDGEFGPDGDADIIKCGSYTGNGSADGPEIDLGFEPQWLLIKNATESGSSSTNWIILDNMRGLTVNGGNDPFLRPNLSNAEASAFDCVDPSATGFKVVSTSAAFNTNGQTFIYIAIRRGPMAVPTDATDVFAMDFATSSGAWTALSGFPIDFLLYSNTTSGSDKYAFSRLNSPNYLRTNLTNAETGYTVNFDRMDGIEFPTTTGDYSTWINWMWKRAPSFFDVVAYTGNGTAGRTVSHNLGVAPEMMWVKDRDDAEDWSVYHAGITNPEQNYLYLNSSSALNPNSNTIRYWNHTAPTDSVFTLGDEGRVNQSGENYIAYLFASLDGVSKVGSYTGDGTTDGSKVIDCGFSSGARFVLIKRTDGGGSWYVWDSERGIVAGNDPRLKLESTDAEASFDNVDPHSSGFSVVGSSINNINGANYIFYAIA